jgi:N-acetyl-beta-hexosaminidase
MTFPRIAALAEVAWGKNPAPDYNAFLGRMQPSFRLYQEKRITCFDPAHPDLTPEVVGKTK